MSPLYPALCRKTAGGEGKWEDVFLSQKAVSTFQRKAETITVIYELLGRHSDKSHREEVLSPPLVLLLLEQTHGQVPGFMELLPFCTRLKQPQPLFVAPMLQLNSGQQGGETAQCANSHTRVRAHTYTLTHTPFTGATMHRNTKVTTSINTSHYEYCFQREAIHGIKTPTRVTPLARTKKLQMDTGVTTAREGSTGCP